MSALGQKRTFSDELANSDNQKKVLRRHADDFDRQAGLLESEAASAKTLPQVPRLVVNACSS